MDKEKSVRKKSTEKYASSTSSVPSTDPSSSRPDLPEAFKRIIGYKEREATFFKTLKETIQMESNRANDNSGAVNVSSAKRQNSGGSNQSAAGAIGNSTMTDGDENMRRASIVPEDIAGTLAEECDNYISPLVKRTGPSISAALVTEGAIDQLDKLHGILEQLLNMQEQNYKLRRATRDVETLNGLNKLHKQVRNTNINIYLLL